MDRISVKTALWLPALQMWKLRVGEVGDLITSGAQVCPTAKPLFFPAKPLLGWAGPLAGCAWCWAACWQLLPSVHQALVWLAGTAPWPSLCTGFKEDGTSYLKWASRVFSRDSFFSLLVVDDHVKGKVWVLKQVDIVTLGMSLSPLSFKSSCKMGPISPMSQSGCEH